MAAAITLRDRVGRHRTEMTLRCADGNRLPVDLTSSLFTDANGRTLAGVFFMDISERRRTEAAMRASEERYRQLADEAPLPVAVIDAETLTIQYANPQAGYLFEMDPTVAVGRSCTDFLVDPDELARFSVTTAKYGRVDDIELLMRSDKGREFWVSMNTTVTTYAGRPALHSVYLDISARKRIEAEMRRLNDELEQRVAERTEQLQAALIDVQQLEESKDAFLASVSHDLRTPLTSVIGMADALEMQFNAELDKRQIHHVQQIRHSGERLLKMVESILHYTALVAGRVTIMAEPCRLIELAAIRMRAMRGMADAKGLKMGFAVEPADIEIVSDANGLMQVLDNLLDNAIKFTPAGGTVGGEDHARRGRRQRADRGVGHRHWHQPGTVRNHLQAVWAGRPDNEPRIPWGGAWATLCKTDGYTAWWLHSCRERIRPG
ncbi:MAG: PAS domain-containing sensor histidine kinase [Anaerolineales bacterium]|nr:PAS domain-containing sensor histidine kinase [Anaerolineales bacterium]